MTTTFWTGNGQNIAQVDTLTVTAVAVGGTLSAVINGKSITYTCVTGDTTTTATTNWLALLQATASNGPGEFSELTFASPTSTTITATANTPGTPFTMTKSQSGGATCTTSTTTANSSQSDVNNSANWLRNNVVGLPQAGDDVILGDSSVPLLWNLGSLSAIALNSWTRYQSYTGSVGLPENNPNGYYEYRTPTYLKLASNVTAFPLLLGIGVGSGPTRERYDMQSYRTNLSVFGSGTPVDTYAVRFLGSHGANTVSVESTSVGVAMLPSENFPFGASINTATVGNGGTLDCGAGCSFAGTGGGGTITITGGTSTLFCTPTVTARNNATLTLAANAGTYASVNATNGTSVTLQAAMTISVLTLAKSSNLDNSGNLGAVTITTSTIDGDTCQINDPLNGITYTNATTVNGQVSTGPITFTGSRTVKVT